MKGKFTGKSKQDQYILVPLRPLWIPTFTDNTERSQLITMGDSKTKKEGLVLLKIFPLSAFLLFFLMNSCGIKSKPLPPQPLSKDPGKEKQIQLEEGKVQPKEKPEEKKNQKREKGKSP